MPDLLTLPPDLLLQLLRGSARTGSGGDSPGGPVTFPTQPLTFRVRLGVGESSLAPADLSADPGTWNWIDITDRVRFSPGIYIGTGKRGFSDLVEAGDMDITLDNTDGYLTRRNPNSPYYGLLTPNTPIWVEVNAGSGWKTRAEMFVNEWPTRWADKSGNDCVVTIHCSGVIRRLEQQNQTLKSPLRRAILAFGPVAYWALEDGSDATNAGSALPNGSVMYVADGTVAFASEGPAGSVSAVDLSGGTASMRAGISGATAPWAVVLMSRADVLTSSSETVFTVRTDGSAFSQVSWGAQFDASTGYTITGVKPDGTTTGANTSHVDASLWHCLVMAGRDIGSGQTRIEAYVDGGFECQVVAVGTPGAPTEIMINRPWLGNKVAGITGSVCHIAVFSNISSVIADVPDFTDAMNGYVGEEAIDRMVRLASELHVPFFTLGSKSPAMGAQDTTDAFEQIRDCEAVDRGLLYEKRWGLGYLSMAERNNAPVKLELDFDQAHIADTPQPDDDDRWLRNRWTVSRVNGGEFTAELKTGPLGTEHGVVEDAATVNVHTDDQLQGQAGWRQHMGTLDEDRWSDIPLNLVRSPALINTYASLPIGARTTVANPPDEMPPETIDVVYGGLQERLNPKEWVASLITFPASAYRVYRVGPSPGNLGRLNSKLSYLAVAVDSDDTSLLVATPGVIWDTTATSLDLNIDGEKVTATVISGSSSPQTFTVTRSVNAVVKSHRVGATVSLWQPPVYALVGV